MVLSDYAPRFVWIGPFDRRWSALGLDDGDMRALEMAIQAEPDRPPLVRGTGGLRENRFTAPGSGRGQSQEWVVPDRVCPFPERRDRPFPAGLGEE